MADVVGERVSVDARMEAGAAAVWAVLADYCGMYTWAPSIEDTECLSDIDRGPGAVRRNTAVGFGAIDQRVTKWREGEGFEYAAAPFGPFGETLTAYHLTSLADDSSTCRLELAYSLRDGSMAGTPAETQLHAKLTAGLQEILAALKSRVETGELMRPVKTA